MTEEEQKAKIWEKWALLDFKTLEWRGGMREVLREVPSEFSNIPVAVNKKWIIKVPVHFNLDWTYWVSITQIKEDIEELENLWVTSIRIEEDDGYVIIQAFWERIETDEEYAARIKIENENKARVEKYELEQLEALRRKYKI